jgi:hypothetical protein
VELLILARHYISWAIKYLISFLHCATTKKENKILKMAILGDEGPARLTTTSEWSPSKSILTKCGFHWWAWRRFFYFRKRVVGDDISFDNVFHTG